MRSRCALASALVAAAAVFVPSPSHAQAAPGIVITTVPRLAHVHFRIDGKPFHSDASGIARATVSGSGEHVLQIRSPARAGSKRRVRFVAWSDGSKRATRSIAVDGTTRIAVGVDVDYIVAEQWRDARGDRVDARLLDSLTFVDEEGKTQTVAAESPGLAGPTALIWQRRPAGTRWLLGTDVEYTADGLESHDVGYEIASARTGFGDIGARAAPFYPARSDTWPISLSAYIGKIDAKGLIAGTPSDVVVTVSGEGDEIGVPDGETLLLGAGDYVAKTNSGGLSPGSSFSLPGPATIGVTVIGWLDIVILLSLAVIVTGIVVASRRRRPAERAPLPSPIAVSHKAPPSPLDRIASTPHGVAPPPARVAPPPSPVAPAPARAAPGNGVAPPPPPETAETSRRELVLVRLDNGRVIEGWVRAGYQHKSVLIIDVTNARDEFGEASTPTPQDAFIPRHLVREMETRDGEQPHAANADAGLRRTKPVL